MQICKVKNYQELSRKAANLIAAQITLKPDSVLGLATGSSPIGTYDRLVEMYQDGDLDFSQITTVNLDEYKGLPGSHEQSYRYFMNTHLFHRVNISYDNTYVPDGTETDSEKQKKKSLRRSLTAQTVQKKLQTVFQQMKQSQKPRMQQMRWKIP